MTFRPWKPGPLRWSRLGLAPSVKWACPVMGRGIQVIVRRQIVHKACHIRTSPAIFIKDRLLPLSTRRTTPFHPPQASTMASGSRRQKGRDNTLSVLNIAIDTLNLAKDVAVIPPAQAAFASVNALLTFIRVRGFPF